MPDQPTESPVNFSASADLLRSAAEQSGSGVLLLDSRGAVRYANPAASRLLDLTAGAAFQLDHLTPGQEASLPLPSPAGGASLTARLFPITLADGPAFLAILHDPDQINDRLALERQNRALAALYETSLSINAQMDLPQLLGDIVERAAVLLKTDTGGLYLVDPGGQSLTLKYAYHLPRNLLGIHIAFGEGVSGRVAQSGKPLMIPNYQHWDGRSPKFEQLPILRSLGVPLKVGQEVIGAVFISDTEKSGPFSDEDIQLATLFADQAAIAIQNAYLFEDEHEQRALSDALRDTASALTSTLQLDEVLERVLDNVGQVVPHDAVNIMFISAGMARVARSRGYQERGIQAFMDTVVFDINDLATLAQMTRTGRFLVIPDTQSYPGWVRIPDFEWVRSFAGAPIRVRGKTIGFLELDSDLPNFFGEAHGERLQVFADQVAVAIENANLFDEVQARAQQLGMIAELATTISRPVDLADVMRAAVSGLCAMLRLEQVGIALFDDSRIHLVVAADHTGDGSESAVGLELPLENNPATRQVIASQAPLAIADAQTDPLMAGARDIIAARKVKSILLLPLIVRGEVIGTVGCDSITRRRAFTAEEMQLAMTVANLVAVRIEQARLLASAQYSAEELNVASGILRSLNAHADIRDTTADLVSGIKALARCDRISLAEIDEDCDEIILKVLDRLEGDPAASMQIGANSAEASVVLGGATQNIPELTAESQFEVDRQLYAAGYRSRLNLPLKPGQKVIGSLNLVWMRPNGYANVDFGLLAQITDAIGIALERTRLIKEAHQRDVILQSLAYANHALLASREPDKIIPAILARLGKALNISRVTIYELPGVQNEAVTLRQRYGWSARGVHAAARTLTFAAGEAGYASARRFFDGMNDGNARHGLVRDLPAPIRAGLSAEAMRSCAMVPIFCRDALWGVARFDDCEHDRRWSLAELESLKNAAASLGAALTRRLAESAEREQRRLAEALRDTAAALNSTLRYNEVLDRILVNLEKVVPHDAATIMLLDNGIARIERSKGYLERDLGNYVSNWHFPYLALPNLRQMATSGLPLCIADTLNYTDWVAMEEVAWVRSYVGAPIQFKGTTVGFLNLDSQTPGFFSAAHSERLRAFADQAAVAIENARLFSEAQEHARRTNLLNDITHATISSDDSAQVLSGLIARLIELFQADTARIVLCEPEGIPPLADLSTTQADLLDAVVTAGKILVVEDSDQPSYIDPLISPRLFSRSLMGLPLIANGRSLGVALLGFDRPHPYTPDEIALGDQAAGQIALAIARVRLLEAERQRTAQLSRANSLITALGEVAARIETAPESDKVLDTLGAELRKLGVSCLVGLKVPGEDAISVRYLSLDTRTLSLAEKLAGQQWRNFIISADRFPAYQQVIVEKRPAFTSEPAPLAAKILPELPPPLLEYIFRLAGINSKVRAISLPLTAEEQVIGVLWLWGEDLQEADLPAISLFASQVAIALENARLYSEVQQLAITDDLTGLYNRRGLMELGRREVERALRFDRPLSAVMLDLDLFKRINDRHGHFVGDQVLRGLSARCKEGIREVDVFGRFGGEEFVILLVENDLEAAVAVAERLRQAVIAAPFVTSAGLLAISASFGVSTIGASITDLHTLIDAADKALYLAKQDGRNRTASLPGWPAD